MLRPHPFVSAAFAVVLLSACNACTPRPPANRSPSMPGAERVGTAPEGRAPAGSAPTDAPPAGTPPGTGSAGDPARTGERDGSPPERATPPIDVVVAPEPVVFRTDGLRIAAFNVEFLFDGAGDEGQADFPWKGNPAAARAHLDAVGAVIRVLDADVIMLVEVENEGVLRALADGPLAGLGYKPYFVQGADRFTGQDMGLLSKIPVQTFGRTDERAPLGVGSETYGVSKNLWARLDLGGTPTTLIGVHFLARPDDASRKPSREAQAEVIRRLVEAEMAAGRAVAVMGDINDLDDTTLDRRGSRPITDVLARIKRAGPSPTDDLRNVIADVAQPRRFTNFWDRNNNGQFEEGEFSAIDHMLLSPALTRRVREVTYAHAHDPRAVTDHFPIVVTLGE